MESADSPQGVCGKTGQSKADMGLIGLAVMGENLVLNMESKGFSGAAHDFLALGALVTRLDPGIIPFAEADSYRLHVSGGDGFAAFPGPNRLHGVRQTYTMPGKVVEKWVYLGLSIPIPR